MNRPVLASALQLSEPYHEEPIMAVGPMGGLWDDYSPKALGPKYPPHDATAPIYGSNDLAGLVVGTVMALGPLSAYAFGFGL